MKKYLSIIIFSLLFIGLVTSQVFFDKSKSKSTFIEPHLFDAQIVKIIDLGLDNAAGDIFWLASIQYFGGDDSTTYEKLNDYLNLATDLNPRFSYPYAFGALILPTINQTDQAFALANKGIKNAEPDWRIPYYTATTYYFNKNDQENALKYFDIASNTNGAPENIKKIAANFASTGDKREKSKQIWSGIYENSNDETVKERAKLYVFHYELMDFLETAIKQYRDHFGDYPKELNDLVTGNILKKIPEDPFGTEFTVNQNNGTISGK